MKPVNHFYTVCILFIFVLFFACSCKKITRDIIPPTKDSIPIIVTPVVDTSSAADSNIVVGNNEILFENIQWIFPWYNALEIHHIYSYVPNNLPFKVFIKRDSSSAWQEVKKITNSTSNVRYEYFIETRPEGAGMYNYGSLYVFYYGEDVKDTPDIKIYY